MKLVKSGMRSNTLERRERTLSPDPAYNRSFAEFFAGIGLVRMALESEGWFAKFANDISVEKLRMYDAHFRDSDNHFVVGDIHTLEARSVPSVLLATASFPCNDLSLAGMRKGLGGAQSSAYWGFIRVLDEMGHKRPPLVLLENVAGFLSSHDGRDFQSAMLALNRLGYVVDPLIIDAERFVPQSRVRLFVVGHLMDGQGSWRASETASFFESDVRPRALAEYIFSHPEIAWDIRDLPSLPIRSVTLEDIVDNSDVHWWDETRVSYLCNQMSERHAKKLAAMKRAHRWSYGTVFRRVRSGQSMAELRTDGVAGCLRTPRGGSGRQILLKAGYGQVYVRLLNPRECARLMGADEFVIDVPLNQALFGFGDAVCVPVVRWIARHYLTPLASEICSDRERLLLGHRANTLALR